MTSVGFESRRAQAFHGIGDAQWNDWRWQLSHRLNKAEELERVFPLSESERTALAAGDLFRMEVTPYFASLIRPEDPADPIRRQVIPSAAELTPFTAMMEDSLAEDRHSPVPGLVHRYPDRALMLVTTQCASYCRYCTRSRIVGDPAEQFSSAEYEEMLEYIRSTPQIRDVLLSGGDPLILAPKVLENLIASLRSIPHVEIIRIGSRVPVFLPMRVDDALCAMLSKYHPLWLNIHVNHPHEITAELAAAADRLSRAGIPLGNQSVLLAGVNDCVHVQRRLVQDLLRIRVRPYYLYQCDLVAGAGHFRTPVAKGIEIMEGLRGHTSGFGVPTFVVDAPGGGGKIPLAPDYWISCSDHRVALRNFEGYISIYEEPEAYPGHDSSACPECRRKRSEAGQTGVTGLLDGEHLAIEPEGWTSVHARGGGEHRLNRDASKWDPRGIGPEKMPGGKLPPASPRKRKT